MPQNPHERLRYIVSRTKANTISEWAQSLTDAQRTELGKRMPAVGGPTVGNLGMDWHTSLPSFEKAKAHASNSNPFPPTSKSKPKLPVKKIGMEARVAV